jgi:colanic acid/amylovoran biosynthesis glycosyltransferase
LINQYPRTCQAAMRREITALEARGVAVDRFTLRASDEELVDERDQAERRRTRAVLGVGAIGLVLALARIALAGPLGFGRAARLAFQTGRRSERGLGIHLIYLAEACVLLRWFSACRTEHVHCHYGTNATAVAMLCRALGGPPYSFTMHGPEEFDSPRTLALAEKIRRAAFVVAISDFTRGQLFRWADHADWPKIHVVHCGGDDLFLESEPTPIPATRRLVCIGRIA